MTALKTFNIDEEIYGKYSKHCKANGISMSKQIENFISNEVDSLLKQKVPSPSSNKDPRRTEPGLEKPRHDMSKYC